MRKTAAIFDLDGTLLDTLEDLKNAVNASLEHFGYEPKSLEEVRSYVGNGVRRLVELSVPEGLENPAFDEIFSYFKGYYGEHSKDHTKPYEGVMVMLERLQKEGIPCAIVSNKLDSAVKVLNELYFGNYIRVAIGDQPELSRKPAPDMVQKALEELKVEMEDAVYIGDSEVDVLTARNAGMKLVCVDWGFRSRSQLEEAGAEKIFSKPEEVTAYLLKGAGEDL